jgi:ribosomal-protein-alanine N-acetyltransferase
MLTIATRRLLLRAWVEADLGRAASWHADQRVMRHLGGVMDREASDATVLRWCDELRSEGFTMLALCLAGSEVPVGAVGLGRPRFASWFTPCVEVGWRLEYAAWGKGYASEAARAVVRDGFGRLGVPEIVAFAAPENQRSQRVMQRIGMRRDPNGDFLRPSSVRGGPARWQVVWRARPGDLLEEGTESCAF